ncbi:sugar transferase [Ascidiimonas aurantiaca]|uniref:sugar transferase n=1 Tax=Ascidiimonas aurantiaca TaxID=1685432 RepID=UPI0030EE3567
MSSTSYIHFEISERRILLKAVDVLSILLGLYAVSSIFDFEYFTLASNNWEWIFVLVVYFIFFAHVFELYDLQKSSKYDIIFPNILMVCFFTVLLYLLTPFLTPVLPDNRLQIVYFFFAITFSLLFWRWAYSFFIASPVFNKNYLIIGNYDEIMITHNAIIESTGNANIVGYYLLDHSARMPKGFPGIKEIKDTSLLEEVRKNRVSEIIIANNLQSAFSQNMFQELILLLESGVPIREYAQVYEELTSRVPVQYIGTEFYRYFPFSRSNQNRLYLFVNRLIDIFFGVLGLLFMIVILPLICTGNLIANRGPVFYSQQRIGRNGIPFYIYKFRTMIPDAETQGARWAVKNDYRVTRFGRLLRNSRLDEVPQFYNVLRGHMSLIGPRPERPEFIMQLSQKLPFYETRHIVKPGITGWAQVHFKYGASHEDSLTKLQYDLYYIKHRSFFLDMRIVIKTLSTIMFYRGH